jgi:hypothetical protein
MKYQQLQKQILELPPGDRWELLKLIVESLQPSNLTFSETTPNILGNEDNSLAKYYGCIDDETFIRHSQPEQPDRQMIL